MGLAGMGGLSPNSQNQYDVLFSLVHQAGERIQAQLFLGFPVNPVFPVVPKPFDKPNLES